MYTAHDIAHIILYNKLHNALHLVYCIVRSTWYYTYHIIYWIDYIDYVNYLIAISYYEQILDEEKDVKPVLKSKEKIELFLKKYPDTDYAIDLRYKLELVINQLAAKEISIARYYIKNEKWIAAINRLKVVVEDYDDTIFIEEALLENEARAAAVLLGYNYNSSEWYKRSYAILNKDYSTQILKKKKEAKVWYEKDDLIKRKIRKIFRKNVR